MSARRRTQNESADRGPLQQFTTLAVRRLDIHIGKFHLVDFFDVICVAMTTCIPELDGREGRSERLCRRLRGYTYGAIIDYEDRWWGFRFGEALMFKRANGLNMQKNLENAHSQKYELEMRPNLWADRKTEMRRCAGTGDGSSMATQQMLSNPRKLTLKV